MGSITKQSLVWRPEEDKRVSLTSSARRMLRLAFVLVILLVCNRELSAYSVLTHMEIIDLVWTDAIRPLLLKHYPDLTEEQITEAHSYAYGGSVILGAGRQWHHRVAAGLGRDARRGRCRRR